MDIKKITFLAVVFNNIFDTLNFCQSLEDQINVDNINIECILIDNSDDFDIVSQVSNLQTQFIFVKVIRPGVNLGYFGAFNFYFDNASSEPSDIVVLCNNDLIFSCNFLFKLSSKKYLNKVFVVCPDVITVEGVHQNPHVLIPRNKFQRLKLDLYFSHFFVALILNIFQRCLYHFYPKKVRRFSAAPGYLHLGIGACYVLLPSFMSKFRKLYFPHFLYGEEAYLTHQVHNAGGKLFFDPDLKVQHNESATLSLLPKQKAYAFARDGYWYSRTFY
jgi:GT2 family glycosyltransferase